nr:MAG TPA: hypothetical protein [Caudoviricetes sp.]
MDQLLMAHRGLHHQRLQKDLLQQQWLNVLLNLD